MIAAFTEDTKLKSMHRASCLEKLCPFGLIHKRLRIAVGLANASS